MSNSLQISDATFTHYRVQALPPSLANCLGYYLLGGSFASSAKNRLINPSSPTATENGAPVYNSNYIDISPTTKGLKTGISISRPVTYVMVVKTSASGAPGMGTWKSGTGTDELFLMDGGIVQLAITGNFRSTITPAPVPAVGSFVMIAGTFDGTTARTAYGAGGAITSASSGYVGTPVSREILIGNNGYPVSAISTGVAAALIFNAALSDAQLLEVYTFLDHNLADLGIDLY